MSPYRNITSDVTTATTEIMGNCGTSQTMPIPTKNTPCSSTGTMAPLPLPRPREAANCPVFCCFYAEFDNQVGPTIVCQSPKNFMDLEIGVPIDRVHMILQQTFKELQEFPRGTRSGAGHENKKATSPEKATDQTEESRSEPKMSIFDSCSEYIITGNELSGNVIKLSAHEMHLLTNPTVILDNAYARNSLLFSVGFILRRSIDSRPFQPIISKWAKTMREMELESQYLSNPATRGNIQSLTEQLLVSLNSLSRECNLLISPAHVLHLKLFHPPRVPAFPVPDYAVPVLLVRDWRQCQLVSTLAFALLVPDDLDETAHTFLSCSSSHHSTMTGISQLIGVRGTLTE